jgi:hypothetical protein
VVELAPDVGVLVDVRRVYDGGLPFPATVPCMHRTVLSSAINWDDVPTWLAIASLFGWSPLIENLLECGRRAHPGWPSA